MNTVYDFEQFQPPVVTEYKLQKELERREMKKQITLLRIASVIIVIAMILLAFLVIKDSVIFAILLVVATCISVVGNGIISVLFYYKGKTDSLRSDIL
ncbi:MAG: hypothetical protein J6Q94_01750 [Clostridia bacterium]|nr:hypothetical protein [Clostridia bacterium]